MTSLHEGGALIRPQASRAMAIDRAVDICTAEALDQGGRAGLWAILQEHPAFLIRGVAMRWVANAEHLAQDGRAAREPEPQEIMGRSLPIGVQSWKIYWTDQLVRSLNLL